MTETTTSRPFSSLVWLIVIGLFLLFSILVFLMPRWAGDPKKAEKARVAERLEKLQAHHDRDKPFLEEYGLVDEQKKIARIPLQRAMEFQVERLKQKPLAPSTVPVIPPVSTTTSTNSPSTKPGTSK